MLPPEHQTLQLLVLKQAGSLRYGMIVEIGTALAIIIELLREM